MGTIVMNVRSQKARLSGVQRYINEMCDQLEGRVQRICPPRSLLGIVGHLWEQSILPGIVKTNLLWSPANSGPLAVAKQVVTIHDLAPLDHPEWFSSNFAAWYRWLIPRLVGRVRRVITVSNFSKARLLEVTRVHDSRVVVIPNGVSDRFFPRSSAETEFVKRRLGIPTENYLLSLGSLEPRKNLERLLSAWSHCQEQVDDSISLVIAGTNGASHIFREVALVEPRRRVFFTEFVPDDWLPALYSASMALIYPSLYEGFGLPVLEGMASGTVPIISNCTALSEIAGRAGIMVNPFDIEELAHAIVLICGDGELRGKLRAEAIRASSRFRWEYTAARSMSVLEDAAES